MLRTTKGAEMNLKFMEPKLFCRKFIKYLYLITEINLIKILPNVATELVVINEF